MTFLYVLSWYQQKTNIEKTIFYLKRTLHLGCVPFLITFSKSYGIIWKSILLNERNESRPFHSLRKPRTCSLPHSMEVFWTRSVPRSYRSYFIYARRLSEFRKIISLNKKYWNFDGRPLTDRSRYLFYCKSPLENATYLTSRVFLYFQTLCNTPRSRHHWPRYRWIRPRVGFEIKFWKYSLPLVYRYRWGEKICDFS